MANPVTEFDQYRRELLAALADRDPLVVLRQTLAEVRQLATGVGPERLGRPPVPGEWSPWQVLSHLADSDLVWGMRVRLIVAQDRPVLVPFDQDVWTVRFGDLDPDPGETIARWTALRLSNLRAYESLSPAEWERIGLHPDRGEQSVREIVQLLAGHDCIHLDQLRVGLAA